MNGLIIQWLQGVNAEQWLTVTLPIAVTQISGCASTEYTDGISYSQLNPTIIKSFNKSTDKYTSVSFARYFGVGYKMCLIIIGFDF